MELLDKYGNKITIGATINVPEPQGDDQHLYEFQGHVTDFRNGNVIVRDANVNYFEIEPERLEVEPNENADEFKCCHCHKIGDIEDSIEQKNGDLLCDPCDDIDEYGVFEIGDEVKCNGEEDKVVGFVSPDDKDNWNMGFRLVLEKHGTQSTGTVVKLYEKVYYVDVPPSRRGEDNTFDEWIGVAQFPTRRAAVKFVKKHFMGDENGNVSLISG